MVDVPGLVLQIPSNCVLAHALVVLRENRNITQADMANTLQMSASNMSRLEKGDMWITAVALRRWCAILFEQYARMIRS